MGISLDAKVAHYGQILTNPRTVIISTHFYAT
jgi:hypothetical protein